MTTSTSEHLEHGSTATPRRRNAASRRRNAALVHRRVVT
jgi:hypothetical protein